MGKGNGRRKARDHKYAEITVSHPKIMVGFHGWKRPVFPELRPSRHGKPVEKPEREDKWH